MNDIDAIRRLADHATKGPWTSGVRWEDPCDVYWVPVNAPSTSEEDPHQPDRVALIRYETCGFQYPHADAKADAEFIAAARQIVPALADEVEQLRAELAKVAAAIAPTVTINPTSDAARFLHNLYQDWVKTAHERLEQVEQLRAELARADAQLIAANRRADGLHKKNAAAQNALRSLGQAYADLKTDNDDLAAENARVRQQRDEFAEQAPTYLIWSQHHRSWWGPNRSGYRSNPADAGRYTLAAAEAEMGRGCYCCQVPEMPVAAGKVIGATDAAVKAAITQATEWAISAGQANKAYEPPVVTVELPAEAEATR